MQEEQKDFGIESIIINPEEKSQIFSEEDN